jgi:hypothetical protein
MSKFARIIDVLVLHEDDHWLRLWFDDGTILDVDVWPLISRGEAWKRVRASRSVFEQVRCDDLTVVWPDNVDLSPSMLYGHYEPASGTRFERRVVRPGRGSAA